MSAPSNAAAASAGDDPVHEKANHAAADDDDNVVEEEEEEEASLSQLLAALAVGARAVQGLPLDDEFAYQASFPEFASQLSSTKAALMDVLTMTLPSLEDDDDAGGGGDDHLRSSDDDYLDDDPLLWERCAEACDALLEDVQVYLEHANYPSKMTTTASSTTTSKQWEHWSARARQRSQGTKRLMEGLVDMVKPQLTHHISVQNKRCVPFVPRVHPDKPFGVTPLDLSLQPGHGLDTRLASIKSIVSHNNNTSSTSNDSSNTATTTTTTKTSRYPDNIIAPTHHVAHVYQTEIESFTYRPWQLEAQEPPKGTIPIVIEPLQATLVDTEPALEQLAAKLAIVSHIAIDLEAHSHRSFSGLTCLMQLSIRSSNETTSTTTSMMESYLLDPFALGAAAMTKHLAGALANPDIVKVMHGADWDVAWLQRDFGLYIVNLFDTGRAARALRFTSAGYAYLLHHYVGITAEKHHQLSDWRQRPIPLDMQQYAIQDTHYLLDIYERLKWDLEQHIDTSIVQVLDVSRKVCLIRFDKEPFSPDGYKWLLGGRGRNQQQRLTPAQERVLATLWDWRDETARECDESLLYVCPNPALLRLSLASPTTVTALQAVLNPIPPLLLRYAPQVVDRIKQAIMKNDDVEEEEEKKATAGAKVTAAATNVNSGSRPPQVPRPPSSVATNMMDDDDEEVANSSSRALPRQPSAGAPSSAYFKPAEMPSNDRPDQGRSGILSPVLGTEALYQQAGWMTPQNHPGGRRSSDQEDENDERDMELITNTTTTTNTTSDDDECDALSKRKHLLVVDKANQNFKTVDYMTHSLEMKVSERDQAAAAAVAAAAAAAGRRRGRSVDGLGPTRAAREHSKSPTPLNAEEQARQAQQAAARVRISLSRKEDGLAMMSPSTELNEEDDEDGEELGGTREHKGDKDNEVAEEEAEEEFVIPRSLKDIYKVSNQNRRNKKSSPTPERSGGANETEMNALAQAEAFLKSRGLNAKGYFDSGDSALGNKRQRTKSTESDKSDDNGVDGANNNSGSGNNSGNVSRDDDIAFMQEIGWIQSKEEAEKMIEQRQGERLESGAPESSGPGDDDNVDEEFTRRVSTSNSNNIRSSRDSKHSHHQQPSPAFDYSTVGAIGAFQTQSATGPSNPFFAGAALTGGALTQGFGRGPDRGKRTGGRGGGGGRQQARVRERPEKKDGRTQVYKKK